MILNSIVCRNGWSSSNYFSLFKHLAGDLYCFHSNFGELLRQNSDTFHSNHSQWIVRFRISFLKLSVNDQLISDLTNSWFQYLHLLFNEEITETYKFDLFLHWFTLAVWLSSDLLMKATEKQTRFLVTFSFIERGQCFVSSPSKENVVANL